MAIYNQQQLISASNATYFTNVYGGISASAVRDLNYSWISSSALLSGSQTFVGDQIISGNVNIEGTFTSSLQTGYLLVGDGSGKTQAVATSSIIANTDTGSLLVTASFNDTTRNITFTKGDNTTFNLGGFATTGSNSFTGSQSINGNVTFNTTGSATTNGLTFPNSKIHQDNFLNLKGLGNVGVDISTDGNATSTGVNINLRNTNNNGDIQLTTSNGNIKLDAGTQNINVYGAVNLISGSNGGKIVFPNGSQLSGITGDQFKFTAGNDASAQFLINSSSQPLNLIFENRGNAGQTQFLNILGTEFHSASSYTFNGGNATFQGNVYAPNITGSTINTGSFATTGSNTFIGIETIQDAGGYTTAIAPYSGSLIFVGKTYTSSSFSHITSSATAANFVNFIFKTNNTTPNLTITGSNNILNHPAAAGAGLRYWVGSNNIFLNAPPQISASMTQVPIVINNNYAFAATTLRGPASSSNTITYAGNLGVGATAMGSAAAPLDKFSGTITVGQNILGNSVNLLGGITPISASLIFSSNQSTFGPTTLNLNSSSVFAFGNIIGNTTLNNNYYHTANPDNNQLYMLANIMQGALINTSGSNSVGGNRRFLTTNIIFTSNGLQNTPFSNASSSIALNQEGSGSSLVGTLAVGLGFVITGSSAVQDQFAPFGFSSGSGGGSAFLGRFNAADGIRDKSAENVLVVGTGTSYSNRKTGLLIDSGSNMFVEGTFNVSGSSSMTGSVAVTGNQTLQSYTILSNVSASLNFSDDTAAAAGGVPLGGLYRNGNFVMIRLT
jgi:hypothetical protein